MNPKLQRFLKERYEHDAHFFQVYDHYTPNYKRSVVTGKFYSKSEAVDLGLADLKLVETIKKARDKGPRDKHPWPETESQVYGWFERLVPFDRSDERFHHPRNGCEITKHEMRIRGDKTMQLPKFTGIPFKL